MLLRLLETRFPPHEAAVPAPRESGGELNTGELLRAVRAVTVFEPEALVCVRLRVGTGRLALTRCVGQSLARDACSLMGDLAVGTEISFRVDYLTDYLRAVGTGVVRLELVNGESAAVFLATVGAASSRYVVMPLCQTKTETELAAAEELEDLA